MPTTSDDIRKCYNYFKEKDLWSDDYNTFKKNFFQMEFTKSS